MDPPLSYTTQPPEPSKPTDHFVVSPPQTPNDERPRPSAAPPAKRRKAASQVQLGLHQILDNLDQQFVSHCPSSRDSGLSDASCLGDIKQETTRASQDHNSVAVSPDGSGAHTIHSADPIEEGSNNDEPFVFLDVGLPAGNEQADTCSTNPSTKEENSLQLQLQLLNLRRAPLEGRVKVRIPNRTDSGPKHYMQADVFVVTCSPGFELYGVEKYPGQDGFLNHFRTALVTRREPKLLELGFLCVATRVDHRNGFTLNNVRPSSSSAVEIYPRAFIVRRVTQTSPESRKMMCAFIAEFLNKMDKMTSPYYHPDQPPAYIVCPKFDFTLHEPSTWGNLRDYITEKSIGLVIRSMYPNESDYATWAERHRRAANAIYPQPHSIWMKRNYGYSDNVPPDETAVPTSNRDETVSTPHDNQDGNAPGAFSPSFNFVA